jgi:hypothetical protein
MADDAATRQQLRPGRQDPEPMAEGTLGVLRRSSGGA